MTQLIQLWGSWYQMKKSCGALTQSNEFAANLFIRISTEKDLWWLKFAQKILTG